jgi:heat shock protein HslJ
MRDVLKAGVVFALLGVLMGGCDRQGASNESGQQAAAGAEMTAPPTDVAAGPALGADAPAGAPGATGAPTEQEAGNATYAGLLDVDGPIALVGGQWEREPYAPDGASRPRVVVAPGFRATGDLDGDGQDEAVVVLAQSSGGSGTYNYLAALDRVDGGVRNVATVALGDRVDIRSASIDGGTLQVSVLRAGEGDAMCCPGELADLAWTLGAEGFSPAASAGVTGRLSFDTLGNAEWVLREWNFGEAVPEGSEVTLAYKEGQIVGSNGCNRYFASIETGEGPGDMTVGPIGATQMACPDPASTVEARYMRQLEAATKFGFLLGRLALTYRLDDGAVGAMLFEAH